MKYSEFPKAVVKENVDYTVHEIKNVIKKYGPRESGNDACYDAEKHIKKELDQFCDETHFEEYKMAPKAFLHFTITVAVCIGLAFFVLIGLIFGGVFDKFDNPMFIPQCVFGGIVLVGLLITLFEFLMYKQFCDVFYKKITAHNLVGVRKPKGEVKKRIVISGHIDAAYEWRVIYALGGKFFGPLTVGGIIFAILSVIISVLSIIATKVDMGSFGYFMVNYSFFLHIITVIFMIPILFLADFNTISPGANDNLTGTYAAVCALRMLDMAGVELENTEVVAMITDGEEAGLRGAKAYAKAHKDEFVNGDVETRVLCVDTLTDYEYMCVYSRDMTGTVRHDKEFSQKVLDATKDAGYEGSKFSNVYFGSSDAAAFTQAGYTATCLAAMDPTPADYYHNRRDTADLLNKDTIEAGFGTVLATILNFDAE